MTIYNSKRERSVYKWQVFLGGIASATILVAGAAAPALAQTAAGSPLSTTVQSLTGSQVTAQACNLGGLPMAGQVNSAVAGVTGQSGLASGSTQQTSSTNAKQKSSTNAKQNSNTNTQQASSSTLADSSTMTSALPGLSAVTGEIPGLSSMSSTLPALNTTTSGDTADSSWAGATAPESNPLSNVSGSSLGSDQPGTATSTVQNTLNGITGTLPVSSLTGGLPNLGSVGGTLSGLTGPQS